MSKKIVSPAREFTFKTPISDRRKGTGSMRRSCGKEFLKPHIHANKGVTATAGRTNGRHIYICD